MATLYKIAYKVVELDKTYSGVHVGPEDMNKLIESFHRRYYDHSLIYIELLEVIEKIDEPSASAESLIILCMTDQYDGFLP